jgi:hypothetical protein
MRKAQRFNFTEGFDTFGVPDALPQLPCEPGRDAGAIAASAGKAPGKRSAVHPLLTCLQVVMINLGDD